MKKEDKLSKHVTYGDFTKSETAEKHKISNEIPEDRITAASVFCQKCVDEIVSRLGSIHINSGWRTKELNAKLPGSSPTSQHMLGNAVDFYAVNLSLVGAFGRLIADESFIFDQLMLEGVNDDHPTGRWIHCSYNTDLRPDQQRRQIKLMVIDCDGKPHYQPMTVEEAAYWIGTRV